MTLELRPASPERKFGDPALVGQWAAMLPGMLEREQVAPWCSYAVRREGELVGLGGFKGPLDATGAVEIGYLTFIPFEGQGIAGQVVDRLCGIAGGEGATAVLAHTLPEENASNRALKSNDFSFDGEVIDPEDGPVWRWRRSLT
jgi:RimJ/RimL family protein N-acetyltransferase